MTGMPRHGMSTYNAPPEDLPRAHGGALHPHHPTDPYLPSPTDPVYWVTPRHLAGDDGALAERVGDTLAGLGWRMWPTSRHTLRSVSSETGPLAIQLARRLCTA
ncbi:hypothetical protein GCM10022233_18730 [Streptomyces shaanxiensis]|uniref:DUF317 domain-containing protein n=1 Tax=Streptomyces shaanxiensis TaxID=653357 RepID=A0ABP7UP95_9ACTN